MTGTLGVGHRDGDDIEIAAFSESAAFQDSGKPTLNYPAAFRVEKNAAMPIQGF